MTLILSGTSGLSDVDGSAATPAIRGTDANTGIFFPAADTIAFSEGGTEAMRIDSSGNVGIGVTPSAWSLLKALQIQNAAFAGYGNTTYVGSNTYFDGANFKYISTAAATLYTLSNSAGQHQWSTAASGTAGNTITFTPAMTLDASGNLLVGTTSTVSNARFVSKSSTSSSSDQAFQFQNSSGTVLLTCRADGYFIAPPVYSQTSGSAANVFVNVDGGLYRSTSSLKYKTDIKDATHGLAEVMQLRFVTYKSKSEVDIGTTFGGLIAEEVHEVGLSEFVQYAEDGSPDALHYGNMVSLAFKAIQEQQAIITQLQADVAALKAQP